MRFRNGVTQASDVELLAVVLGNRKTADALLKKAGGSLFALLNEEQPSDADFGCAESAGIYSKKPIVKLLAARELATRAITEQLQVRDCFGTPSEVRELLKHRLAGLPHEVFVCLFLDNQNRLIVYEELFRGTLGQTSVYPREVLKAALRVNAIKFSDLSISSML